MLGHIFRSKFDAQRNALHFPIVELPTGAGAFALIERDANICFGQFCFQLARSVEDRRFFFVGLVDRNDHHLVRRNFRGQNQPLVVAVHHDDGPDDARGEPPRSRPAMLKLPILVQIAHFKCLRKISHHGFDGVGDVGAGKLFGVRFFAGNHGNSRIVHREVGVNVQHLARFRLGLFARGVCRVPLLPEKLQRAQEEFRAQLPAHHAVPLIHQHR